MRKTRTTVLTTAALVALVATSVFAFGSGRGAGPARELRASEVMGHAGVAVSRAATGPITRAEAAALEPLAAAPGWAGEIKIGTEDTWEPSIAADPSGPYVYVMYNRFGGPKACKQCPPIPMLLRVSSDNGATWSAESYPCPCPGVKQFQYDPVVKVASNGVVYATWMNKYDMVFSKSTNHGATWTAPIEVSGSPWGDKPWIGVSPDGVHVYIAYATSSDVWVAASHNSGASFAPAVKLNTDSGRYRYPNGLEVLPNGTAVLSASDYPGSSQQASGSINIETWRTTNGGSSWTRTVLGQVFYRRELRDIVDHGARERQRRHARGAVLGCDEPRRERAHLVEAIDRRRRDMGARGRARQRRRQRELPRDRGWRERTVPHPLRG